MILRHRNTIGGASVCGASHSRARPFELAAMGSIDHSDVQPVDLATSTSPAGHSIAAASFDLAKTTPPAGHSIERTFELRQS